MTVSDNNDFEIDNCDDDDNEHLVRTHMCAAPRATFRPFNSTSLEFDKRTCDLRRARDDVTHQRKSEDLLVKNDDIEI